MVGEYAKTNGRGRGYRGSQTPNNDSSRRHQGRRTRQSGEKRGTHDMRELTAALLEARDGEVAEILMRSTFRPRLPGLTKIMSRLGKEGFWKKALELFETSINMGMCEPDTALANAAISACDRGGQWQKALEYFDKMDQMRIPRDAITYSATISSLGKGKQWEGALRVFDHMKKSGIKADVVTCCSLINALEKSGQWEMAEALFYHMKGGGNSHGTDVQDMWSAPPGSSSSALPDFTSPNSVLKAVVRHNSGMPSSNLPPVNEDASVAEDDFRSLGFICSPVTDGNFAAPLSGIQGSLANNTNIEAPSHDSEHSFTVSSEDGASRRDSLSSVDSRMTQDFVLDFSHLSTDDVQSGNTSLRRSISCFPQVAQTTTAGNGWSDSSRNIDFSHASGITPNRVCCNSLLAAYARARPTQWRRAVDFLQSLWNEEESMQPDVVSYNTTLKACANAFQVKHLEMVFRDMRRREITPNLVTFQCCITAAKDGQNSSLLEEAMDWINEYSRFKTSCSALLVTACVRCDMLIEGLETFQEGLKTDPKSICESSETIFAALVRYNDTNWVVRLLDLMAQAQSLPSVGICCSLIDFLCRQNKWSQACKLLETLLSRGDTKWERMNSSMPPANVILRTISRNIAHEESQDEKERMLSRAITIYHQISRADYLRPDKDTYCYLIQISQQAGDNMHALAFYETMTKSQLAPDGQTMNHVLLASLQTGETGRSIHAIVSLVMNSVELNEAVFFQGLDRCLEEQEWHLALTLCEAVSRAGRSRPSTVENMYSKLLRNASNADNSNVFSKILDSIQHHGVHIDPMLAAQVIGTSAMNSKSEESTNARGSLFYTEMESSDTAVVHYSEEEHPSEHQPTPVSRTISLSSSGKASQMPSQEDMFLELTNVWLSKDITLDIKESISNVRQGGLADRDDQEFIARLVNIIKMVIKDKHHDLAIEMCSDLHDIGVFKFYQLPKPIYSVNRLEESGINEWGDSLGLTSISPDAVHVIVACWLAKAHQSLTWGYPLPRFETIKLNFKAESAKDFELLSLGIFRLLTTGQSMVLSDKKFPHLTDTNVVTLFQEDETHGGIEINTYGLKYMQ